MEERKNSDYTEYYENIDIIGTGAFGFVYKVREREKEKNYRAVKVIKLDELRNSIMMESGLENLEENLNSYIDDYIKEYEIMKLCSENNVNSVKCYEYFQNDETFAIVMELCDQNLDQMLNEKLKKCKEGFKPIEIYEIMKQLNNAFKNMVEKKVIHRDLKLENILVKYNDKEHNNFTLKLSDYGCSRRLDSLSRNKCSTNVGTLIYTAPEILNRELYNYKVDLWSIGIILYRLRFVKTLFIGETEVALLNKIFSFKKSSLNSTGNKELDDLITILIEKEPTKRASWNEYFEHPFFKDKKK